MLQPQTTPWGKVNYCFALAPDFYYVVTDLQTGYLISKSFVLREKVESLLLSGRLFDDYYVFPSGPDAMQLVLYQREFAWHIYRNFCIHANTRMTFWEFVQYARSAVHSHFPFLESLFRFSVIEIEAWVKVVSRYFKYLWMEKDHPFSSTGMALYIPKGWVDGSKPSDLEPSVMTENGKFRITYSSIGIPYYLTLCMQHPIFDLLTGALSTSDYNVFHLMDKAREYSSRLDEGLSRYNALMNNQVPVDGLSDLYHLRIKKKQPLDMFLKNLKQSIDGKLDYSLKKVSFNYLPEAVLVPDFFYSSLLSVENPV